MKKLILSLFFIFVFCSVSMAENHYVTEANVDWFNNPNNCSKENTSDGKMGPGDIVYFSEDISTRLVLQCSGDEDAPLILDGYEGGDCDDPIGTNCPNSIKLLDGIQIGTDSMLSGVSYVEVRDFVIHRRNINATAVHITAPSGHRTNHILFHNNFVRLSSGSLFNAYRTQYVVIKNNRFHTVGIDGYDPAQVVNLNNMHNTVFSNNSVYHNESGYPSSLTSTELIETHLCENLLIEYNDIYAAPNQSGIRPKENGNQKNIIIRYNKIHDNHSKTDSGEQAGHGILADTGSFGATQKISNLYIYGNYIYGNYQWGIGFAGGVQDAYAWSNIVTNNGQHGIILFTNQQNSPKNVVLFNNTVSRNGTRGDTDWSRGGIVVATAGNNLSGYYVKNNIYVNNKIWGSSNLYNQMYSSTPLNTLDYNIHHVTGQTPTIHYLGENKTIADMQSSYSFCQNAIIGSPLFVDTNGPDDIHSNEDDNYSLQNGSNAIDSGDKTVAIVKNVNLSNNDLWFERVTGYSNIQMTGKEALLPSTSWEGVPDKTKIKIGNQDEYGSGWERGAYIYVDESVGGGTGVVGEKQVWYLTPTGGETFNGKVAISASYFNDPANWSENSDPNKLDPCDIVYPKGTWFDPNGNYLGSAYDLTPVYGITIDGWEDGDWDAINPPAGTSRTTEPLFKNVGIIVGDTPGVTVRDLRFGYLQNGIPRSAGVAIDATVDNSKASFLTVERCSFYNDKFVKRASIATTFITDSNIVGNWFFTHFGQGTAQTCKNFGRSMNFHGGSRNKITDNYIDGGMTGIYVSVRRDYDNDGVWDIPSSGSYKYDPDHHWTHNEIARNVLVRRCDEGITFDPTEERYNPNLSAMYERDFVESYSGNTLTLANQNWDGKGDMYSGLYMIAMTPTWYNNGNPTANHRSVGGRTALIESQNGAVFTFADDVEKLFPGIETGAEPTMFQIGSIVKRNWIHHNTIPTNIKGHSGFYPLSIFMEAPNFENLIENNQLGPAAVDWRSFGIRLQGQIKVPPVSGSVTGLTGSSPSSFNIVRNNKVDNIISMVHTHNDELPGLRINQFNNSIYDNSPVSDGVTISDSSAYIKNTGIKQPGSRLQEILNTDPTVNIAQWFSKWDQNINRPDHPYPCTVSGGDGEGPTDPPIIDPPEPGVKPSIVKAIGGGNQIVIDFTESVSVNNYGVGDFYLNCNIAGNNLPLNKTSNDGGSQITFCLESKRLTIGENCSLNWQGGSNSIVGVNGESIQTVTNYPVDTGKVGYYRNINGVGTGAGVTMDNGSTIIVSEGQPITQIPIVDCGGEVSSGTEKITIAEVGTADPSLGQQNRTMIVTFTLPMQRGENYNDDYWTSVINKNGNITTYKPKFIKSINSGKSWVMDTGVALLVNDPFFLNYNPKGVSKSIYAVNDPSKELGIIDQFQVNTSKITGDTGSGDKPVEISINSTSVPQSGKWVKIDSPGSNGGAMIFLPGTNKAQLSTPPASQLSFNFKVAVSGWYRFYTKCKRDASGPYKCALPPGDDNPGDNCNDVFINVDNLYWHKKLTTFGNGDGTYRKPFFDTWRFDAGYKHFEESAAGWWIPDLTMWLEAGDHNVKFGGRSPYVQIDMIYIRPVGNYESGDLIGAHFDFHVDPDDMQAAAASKTMLLHHNVSNYYGVRGTHGDRPVSGVLPDSKQVMDACFRDNYFDVTRDGKNGVASKIAPLWINALNNGKDVWIEEAGSGDVTYLTAQIVRKTVGDKVMRERVHVVQHGGLNQKTTTGGHWGTRVMYFKNNLDYIKIDNGNLGVDDNFRHDPTVGPNYSPDYEYSNNPSVRSSFQSAAEGHSRYGDFWRVAFQYYDKRIAQGGQGYPNTIDFSDAVELNVILGVPMSVNSVPTWQNYYLQ